MPAGPLTGRAAADDLGVLISSGGTTGTSKASIRSFEAYGRTVDVVPTPGRRQLVCTPLAYVAQVLVDQSLLGGGSAVMLRPFDPAEVLRTIAADRITHLGLVEPALVELIDHPDFTRTDLSSLVAISHIGANAPASLSRASSGARGDHRPRSDPDDRTRQAGPHRDHANAVRPRSPARRARSTHKRGWDLGSTSVTCMLVA